MRRQPNSPLAARLAAYGVLPVVLALTWLAIDAWGADSWRSVALLGAAGIVLGNLRTGFPGFGQISPVGVAVTTAGLVLEPGLAAVVAIVIGVGISIRRGPLSCAINVTMLTLPVLAMGALSEWARGLAGLGSPSEGPVAWFLLAFLATLVFYLANALLAAVAARLRFGAPMGTFLRDAARPLFVLDPIIAVSVAALSELYLLLSGSARVLPILVAAGTIASVPIFHRSNQRRMEAMGQREDLARAIFTSFARLLEMKDPETAGHSARVAMYSRDIALIMGLDADEQGRIHLAGLLHDVGKVGVPDEVLLKPGRLTDEERLMMEDHARLSAEALAGIPGFADLAEMVYAHHERLDGSGYPEGLKDPDIPLGARILGVADTLEAITAVRPYRPARTVEQALAVLTTEDWLFDQEVVAALRTLVEMGSNDYRYGTLADFTSEWEKAGAKLPESKDMERVFVVPARRRPAPGVPVATPAELAVSVEAA